MLQEDDQMEGLQAELEQLKGAVAMEGAEKLHLQRRVTELEDANHSLRRQVEFLKEKVTKLAASAEEGQVARGMPLMEAAGLPQLKAIDVGRPRDQ